MEQTTRFFSRSMGRWLMTLMLVMLSSVATKAVEAYACYTPSNTTLTFYYDNLRSSRPGTTYDLDDEVPGWYRDLLDMDTWTLPTTRVIIDPSFAGARPTSTFIWFAYMNNVQSITGIGYLNTSEVTNMYGMFEGCSGLTSLDLSHFNTAKVTDMFGLFEGCSGLTSLDLSSFNTSKVTNMAYMFERCSGLTSLDLSNFNTANVTKMNSMFADCSGLTSLDLSSFNTSNVTDMSNMFGFCSGLTSLDLSSFNTSNVTNMWAMFCYCTNLTTIYASSGWSTANVDQSGAMFASCTSLVGGKGTTYNAYIQDKTYAHIDGGPSNPGYFTAAIIRGDVNGDFQVKINDVTALINFLLSHNGTGINLHGADANQSGGINISDVTALINYLLSGSW